MVGIVFRIAYLRSEADAFEKLLPTIKIGREAIGSRIWSLRETSKILSKHVENKQEITSLIPLVNR